MVAVFLLAVFSVSVFLQSQGQKIHEAKIYSDNTEVLEGGKLELTCSIFGYSAKAVYLYLCKNGKAIDQKKQRNQQDINFRIEGIQMEHSGNYSCVFSEEQLETTNVMGYGDNYIFINVIESLIRAQIHLLESEVPEGSDVEFMCTSSHPLNTNQSRNLILAYLIKDRKAVEVSIWDTQKMKTTFTLRKVQMEDAGTYSCVVLLNILPHPGMRLYGSNEVNLQITVASNSSTEEVKIVLVCSGIVLLLCLSLGILTMIRKRVIECPGFHSERSLENEVEIREAEAIYEDTTEATSEIQSVVRDEQEWDEFSDSEEDPNENQPHNVSQLYTAVGF
ncbi:uncharacterized protein LOC127456472 [Myxocyprinus asiaticus]|uniref:uncharacterized protein LOC127456472 n=1 Tax=Myxocyprinus asiaticus TaxID=70543 RepID=UPI002221C7D4|nr:uncharacterized protein LOC127456472 [Myxocyprinus asiaticus]